MKDKGLYRKFSVIRNDGKSAEGEKHENCFYFVLDLTHDIHAIPALRAYAKSCAEDYPELSKDLLITTSNLETEGTKNDD